MTVVIGFDDTAYGRDALELGLQLAGADEPATVVTVYPDDARGLLVAAQDQTWVKEVRAVAEAKLEAARAAAGERAGRLRFEAVGLASPARGLHEYAEEHKADVVVLGSSEHAAIGRVAPGSTVERLLHGAPCPVAVAPRGYRRHPREIHRIAVAFDGGPEARHALGVAADLATRCGATLTLAAVSGRADDTLRRAVEEAAAALPQTLAATGELVIDDDVVETLADLPGYDVDLLVCGSRGYGPARQTLLGSVSNRLVRGAAYPVMVVPRGAG